MGIANYIEKLETSEEKLNFDTTDSAKNTIKFLIKDVLTSLAKS